MAQFHAVKNHIYLAGEATKSKMVSHMGVVISRAVKPMVREFIEAMKQHRHFDRADKQVPALRENMEPTG